MLGKRSKQQGLFESDHLYLQYVGADSFYGYLASQRNQLFRDEDYAEMYCPDNGRPGVPPSQLAIALLLQTYEKVSDEEAKRRADYDLCWKVALGIEVEERPFAKSTLQLFRSQLIPERKNAGGISMQPGDGERDGLFQAAQAESGTGHEQYSGAGSGEGHIQFIGGWGAEIGKKSGESRASVDQSMEQRKWIRALSSQQYQRGGNGKLG